MRNLILVLLAAAATTSAQKPRARDLGVPFHGTPGRWNAITDVAGVTVGHTTLIEGQNVRTGVTAIWPRGTLKTGAVFAGWFSLNGNGEMTGTPWIEESGFLDSPVLLTNTHSVGTVRDAFIRFQVERKLPPETNHIRDMFWSMPVVAETYDGYLNDTNGFHVRPEHVFQALEKAASGPVAEGSVGGGTGMICYGFKGGIGTSSRTVAGYTVAALVQCNCGGRTQLRIGGRPVGEELASSSPAAAADQPGIRQDRGSIIIVIATDAPLVAHQLKRLARRAALGLARTGSTSSNYSGDLFIAFSTANPGVAAGAGEKTVRMLANEALDPIFTATVDSVEEAITNVLFAAETMTGFDGHRVDALPVDRVLEILKASAKSAPAPAALRIGPDGRHLVDRAGQPVLLQGDSPWSLIVGLTREEAEQYLENRREKGFNALIVNLIEHKFHGPVNRYGEGPFTTPGDFSTPNEKYFQHADWVIRKAGEKGIQVFLAPIYLGYIGTDEGWFQEALANGPEKCRAWGRYLGRRYRDFDNIVWMMGGDRNPGDALPHVNAVAEGIREFDTRHLFTAHCHPENSAAEQYRGGGWLDLNTTYTYGIVHRKLLEDFHRTPAMPFVLIESTYEGEHNASPVQIRRQAYWAMLCGAAGQFMGNRPMWLFDPGWKAALDGPGSEDMARLNALFRSRAWYDLAPDDRHEVITDGLGEFNGLDYVTAARTRNGETVIAYLPSARTVTANVVAATRAWWFDPRTGKSAQAGDFSADTKRQFTPPASGDWVLVLDDASRRLPPPGSVAWSPQNVSP